jgi:hypothetical protein
MVTPAMAMIQRKRSVLATGRTATMMTALRQTMKKMATMNLTAGTMEKTTARMKMTTVLLTPL